MKNKTAKYICIEGVEGVGKTTQITLIKEALESKGFKVIVTKEPGTDRVPLTLELRKIGLDPQNSNLIKGMGREYLWQAIRTIHLNQDVYPNLSEVDYIIQDRGIPSGLAYGMAFGMKQSELEVLNNISVLEKGASVGIKCFNEIYDHIIFFQTAKAEAFLENAKNAKQEFKSVDGIESEGPVFMEKVLSFFPKVLKLFPKKRVHFINVEESPGKLKDRNLIRDEVLNIICSKT